MKKKIITIVLCFLLFQPGLQAQTILEAAAKIMKILGLDVPVFDLLLTGAEEDWQNEEKDKWDNWQSLYDDFCDVFDGRIKQMIERHTGFKAGGDNDLDKLLANTENILDFAEESVYYSEYLEQTFLSKLKKANQTKTKDDEIDESEEVEFREALLEDEAQNAIKRTEYYAKETVRAVVDERIINRNEEIKMKMGFANLLTQVQADEKDRYTQMLKRLEELEKKSKAAEVKTENANGEEVTDTAEIMAVMISVTEDLAMADESINKIVKYYRDADIQVFLNRQKVLKLSKGEEK